MPGGKSARLSPVMSRNSPIGQMRRLRPRGRKDLSGSHGWRMDPGVWLRPGLISYVGSLLMTQWGPWWAAGSGSESAETLQGPSGAVSSQSISLDSGTNVICWFLHPPHISVTGRAWVDPACSVDVGTWTVGGVLGPHGQATTEGPPHVAWDPPFPSATPAPPGRGFSHSKGLEPRPGCLLSSPGQAPGLELQVWMPIKPPETFQVSIGRWERLAGTLVSQGSERNKSRWGQGKLPSPSCCRAPDPSCCHPAPQGCWLRGRLSRAVRRLRE